MKVPLQKSYGQAGPGETGVCELFDKQQDANARI